MIALKTEIDSKQSELKYIAINNLYFLSKGILGYSLLQPIPHKELCDWVQAQSGNILDLEPRDHFKTSCITISYSIFLVINNPNIRILINHKVLKKAKEVLREIKGHFETNEIFKYFFGDMVGDVWKQDEIIVKQRTENYKEPTIAIGATDHEVTSAHYDYIFNDDLAGLKDMVSEAERVGTQHYISSLKFLRDKSKFKAMITTGTRWHLEDCYKKMIETYKPENIRIRKAVIDGKPYFPERYSLEDLKEIEVDDPVFYESQMMNNPTAMQDQLYKLDDLNFFDYDGFKEGYNIGYIDPAFGKKEKGQPCYFSMVILSIINDNIYVIAWPSNQNKPEQNELMVIENIREYKLRRLGIESNAQQSEFIRNVEKELRKERIIINVEPINHSTNKDRRIQSMHGTVKKAVYFRKDWDKAYSISMKQLTLYPYSKFKDAPDCLEGGISMIDPHPPTVRMI